MVEGEHGDGVGAADTGGSVATVVRSMFTHGSRRVIIAGEVTACWRCAAAAAGAPHTCGDARPQPARGAQLGDRQELVGGRRRSGTRAARRPRRRWQPRLGERPQVGDAGGEGRAELLRRRNRPPRGTGRASTVSARSPGYSSCALRRAPRPRRCARRARPLHRCERRARAGSAPRLPRTAPRGDATLLVQRSNPRAARLGVRARVEHDGGEVEVHAVQGPASAATGRPRVAQHEPEGGDAVLQVGQPASFVRAASGPRGAGAGPSRRGGARRRGPGEGREAGETTRSPKASGASGAVYSGRVLSPSSRRWTARLPPPDPGLPCPTCAGRPLRGAATAHGSRPGTRRPEKARRQAGPSCSEVNAR